MAKIQVNFYRCIQDSQEFGSDDEHMVSRLFCSVTVDERKVGDFHADIKQTVGADYETGPLEVTHIESYQGPWDHQKFSMLAEHFYRRCVGSQGKVIKIGPGASNIRMQHIMFDFRVEGDFQADSSSPAW